MRRASDALRAERGYCSLNTLPEGAMSRSQFRALLLLVAACSPYSPPPPPEPPMPDLPPARVSASGVALQDQVSGLTARLQAVSAVDERVVWISGTRGSFAVSVNGGRSWRNGVVAGADSLEFRDVQGVNAKTAYLLSAGTGTASRIYKTTDGGQNWQLQFVNREPNAFYDCFAFWDELHGIAWSDNVDGRFPVASTSNGGQRWTVRYVEGATEGEGAFAASGTCVITHGKDAAWAATGAGKQARVFHTQDRAATWTSVTTPIVQGTPTTGHATITFRDALNGLAAGGDIGDQADTTQNVIITQDGGKTWATVGRPSFPGPVYGAVYIPGGHGLVVAVGPKGASWSPDDGRTWQVLDTLEYWSAGFASRGAGWLVGPGGRVTRVGF